MRIKPGLALVTAALVATAAAAQTPPPPPPGPPPPPSPAATPAGVPTATAPTSVSERQQLDMAECQNLASQATGYVPGAATAAPVDSKKGPSGQRAAGAAKGAAAGAIVGEVQGNDYPRAPQSVQDQHRQDQAATGAIVGTVAGGSKVRQDRRQTGKEQQKAEQELAAKQQAWDQQYRGCLTQRGYTVK